MALLMENTKKYKIGVIPDGRKKRLLSGTWH